MKKKLIINLIVIFLIFIIGLIFVKSHHLKFLRKGNDLIVAKEVKLNPNITTTYQDLYNEGDKVVLRISDDNYIVTNVYIDEQNGEYITMVDDAYRYDEVRANSSNIIGLYKLRLKNFYGFFESKITKLLLCIIAIGIVLIIRNRSIVEENRKNKAKKYTH